MPHLARLWRRLRMAFWEMMDADVHAALPDRRRRTERQDQPDKDDDETPVPPHS